MLIIFEISKPFQPKPGKHAAPFNGKRIRRFWWLWFAVTLINTDLYSFGKHIASGQTVWTGCTEDKTKNGPFHPDWMIAPNGKEPQT